MVFVCLFETGFLHNFGACPWTRSFRPGWPWTHKDLPASASQVLGLRACATWPEYCFDYVLSKHFFIFYSVIFLIVDPFRLGLLAHTLNPSPRRQIELCEFPVNYRVAKAIWETLSPISPLPTPKIFFQSVGQNVENFGWKVPSSFWCWCCCVFVFGVLLCGSGLPPPAALGHPFASAALVAGSTAHAITLAVDCFSFPTGSWCTHKSSSLYVFILKWGYCSVQRPQRCGGDSSASSLLYPLPLCITQTQQPPNPNQPRTGNQKRHRF